VSAAGPKIRSVRAYTASARHVDKVLARKWRPTFFLLSGAKKVGRHKSGQINGLCLEAPAPNTEKWRFWASKNRHFPPIFSLPILGGDQPGPRGRGEEKTCTAAPLRRSVHSRKPRFGAQSASGFHAIIENLNWGRRRSHHGSHGYHGSNKIRKWSRITASQPRSPS
jgi:hypothetical protein